MTPTASKFRACIALAALALCACGAARAQTAELSDDAGLREIRVSDIDDNSRLARISPAAGVYTYEVNVPYKADGVDFTVVPSSEDVHSVVMTAKAQTPHPRPAHPGSPNALHDANLLERGFSKTLWLTPDRRREAVFLVTAQDQQATLTYALRVTRETPRADTPAVEFDRYYYSADEGGALTITVRVTPRATAAGASVPYALADDGVPGEVQYQLRPPSPLTFAPGESEKQITLTPADNDYVEWDNIAIPLTLNVPDGYRAGADIAAEVDVYDEEAALAIFGEFEEHGGNSDSSPGAGLLNYTAALSEGATFLLPVSISASASEEVVFRARATGGSARAGDYHIVGEARFAARDATRSRNIEVVIAEDFEVEEDETIILQLENAGGEDSLGGYYEFPPAATAVLTIKRSNDATLDSLNPSAGALVPVFSAQTETYTLAVPHAVARIQFLAGSNKPGAPVINGVERPDGLSHHISLVAGKTRAIPIIITAPDGITSKTYTIITTRAAENAGADAKLSELIVHAGREELALTKTGGLTTPRFDPAHETYSASPEVAHDADLTLLTHTTDPNARARIGSEAAADGAASAPQPLVFGENTVEVVVTAENAADTKTYSVTVTRAAGPPLAPQNFRAIDHAGHLGFEWSRHVDGNGAKISGYKLRWKRADAADYAAQDVIDTKSIPAFLSETFLPGIAYTAQVAAVNAIGDGAWSEPRTGTPRGKPGAPQNTAVTPGRARLHLSWSPPENDGGDAITAHRARWRLADDNGRPGAWELSGPFAASYGNFYAITGLANGATYEAQVAAVNVHGASEWSGAQRGVPQAWYGLDMDGAGGVTWRDGALIVRYLLGMRGAALTAGLTSAPPQTPEANIQASLDNDNLDMDGDGDTTVADGILLARCLLGVLGDALIAGQTHATASAVEQACATRKLQ